LREPAISNAIRGEADFATAVMVSEVSGTGY
jgi:hypothetical protein